MTLNTKRRRFFTAMVKSLHGRKYWEKQHQKRFGTRLPFFSMPVKDGTVLVNKEGKKIPAEGKITIKRFPYHPRWEPIG